MMMQKTIKSILQIDKIAMLKEENAKLRLKDLENEKQLKMKQMRTNIDDNTKKQLEEHKIKMEGEIDSQREIIENSSTAKIEELVNRYHTYSEKVSKQAFNMVLRDLEG